MKTDKYFRKIYKNLRKIEKHCNKHGIDPGYINKIRLYLHNLGYEIDQYT